MNREKLQPLFPKKRYRCPFYGFHMSDFGFVESMMTNQCGEGDSGVCQMEADGKKPDWGECFLNSVSWTKIEYIKKHYNFYPWEFPSRGLSFAEWLEYVMSQPKEV